MPTYHLPPSTLHPPPTVPPTALVVSSADRRFSYSEQYTASNLHFAAAPQQLQTNHLVPVDRQHSLLNLVTIGRRHCVRLPLPATPAYRASKTIKSDIHNVTVAATNRQHDDNGECRRFILSPSPSYSSLSFALPATLAPARLDLRYDTVHQAEMMSRPNRVGIVAWHGYRGRGRMASMPSTTDPNLYLTMSSG